MTYSASARRVIRLLSLAFASVLLVSCSQPRDEQSQPTPALSPDPNAGSATGGVAKWTVTEGIETPESVYVDPASASIFVSQVTGAPDARDGTGRIVKLSSDGNVESTSWVTGLNAPKGLRGCNGMLWVADLDEVVAVEISSGKIASHVKLEGAKFPNDVACGSDGTVYVSDMMGSRIYMVKDGKASVFAEGEDLEYPNGLLAENDRLVVGAWGKPEADFSTKVPGRLFALDLKTKSKTLITPDPFANIDGVESDGAGGYILTDWIAGKVYHVTSSGEIRLIRQFAQGTADHAFVASEKLLIIPHMNENKVAAYDISDALR